MQIDDQELAYLKNKAAELDTIATALDVCWTGVYSRIVYAQAAVPQLANFALHSSTCLFLENENNHCNCGLEEVLNNLKVRHILK